jgi:hypothetical protein
MAPYNDAMQTGVAKRHAPCLAGAAPHRHAADRNVKCAVATPIIKDQDPDMLATLPLDELNHEIGRCPWGYENGRTSLGRRTFFKRLVTLEGIRSKPMAFQKTTSVSGKVRPTS